ncbi:MAG: hypothetical protein NTV49_12980 [Kiritimatiellaeota bacterium]|nr:hypothetical protein [Kiritimatiellota bacterium]
MDRDKKSQNMQRTVSGALDILGSAHADSTVTVNGQGTTRQDAYYGTRKNGNLYEQYIWSARYLDAPVLRDRDADGQSYNGLEERLYYTGDAHFNVTALVNISGAVVERYEYDPYGKAISGDWPLPRETSDVSLDARLLAQQGSD